MTCSRPLLLVFLLGAAAMARGQEPADPEGAPPEESSEDATSFGGAVSGGDDETPETIPVDEPAPAEVPAARDATVLDTIEVTSQKRVKAQRDIPGSVGAIRGEELERMRAQGLADYLKLIPGVNLTDRGSGRQIVVIRGIASSTGGLGTQFTGLTTGIYLDDMPFNDLFLPLSVPDLNPFDLERVEVLKGPQGTLFGSSSLAGAIRYVVQKPNPGVWQAKAQATVMQTETGGTTPVGAAAFNAPLFGGKAAIRAVGLYRDESGFYDALPNNRSDRPDGGNTRNEEGIDRVRQFTGRVLGRWDVTDAFKLSAFYFQQDTEQRDLRGSANNRERPERNDLPFPSPFEAGFGGTNLSATYDFGATSLFYTGNLLEKDVLFEVHGEDGLFLEDQNETAWYNLFGNVVDGVTHELRWSSAEGGDGPWEWLAGVSFLDYQQDTFQYVPNPGPADSPTYTNPPRRPEDVSEADQRTSLLWADIRANGQEKALFGEATRRLGEHWEVTAGARVYQTDLVADSLLRGTQINALVGADEIRSRIEIHEEGVNPKFSLRYLHNRNIQSYVLVAKGFQFGGAQVNPPAPAFQASAESRGFNFGGYKSSTLWNYEMGLRTEWLDRRLRFDLALFYLDWKDLQLTLAMPFTPETEPIPCTPIEAIPCGDVNVTFNFVANVGRAHSEGLEAILQVLPFAGASFTSSAAWISALTDEPFDFENPAGPVPAGTRLPGTPRFQWANVFAYEHSLPYFTSLNGGLALTHSHIGTSPNSIRRVMDVGGFDTLDARVELSKTGAVFWPEISLGLNNVTDVRGFSAYNGNGADANTFLFIRPRTALLTLGWRY